MTWLYCGMNVHGDDAPQREDYEDVREFIRDHDAYWNAATPTKLAVLQRAARLANDAAMAIKMQFDRIDGGPMAGDPDGFWKALIDVDFLIAALWRLHLAGRLAQSALGGRWVPLEEFNAALPDLKLMRDVTQHIHEYGTDFDRRHNPNVGRRALEVKSLGKEAFNWLGGTLDFNKAAEASSALLSAIRAARDDEYEQSRRDMT
ncbi:hypothetical protein [Mycobacteroides abscessus]|uniref:hypothetical protein n=2 Tax=Mycobacteriaceae TaxID=1762 RepID=UPI0007158416|nr:hypothetical protein [Mycobacteroides abscessus]KRQ31312.1 hypothetical protein AOT86_01470 [Mycobacteroides sp. H072]MBN7369297.1 hypothetical protein [Mycobacteroides abscessus subsp. abscessus]MBN7375721.1 hypothetical protein [Mycobacteroides abscessus subsp. massiliense]MBN7493291.1 hypothetical protein [Mycobacteroides abscessus subsp. abscessus]MDM2319427.1 hypothetical protein [Mycobacteroides abscessus]